MVKKLVVFCVFSLGTFGLAWADMSECSKLSDQDKKN